MLSKHGTPSILPWRLTPATSLKFRFLPMQNVLVAGDLIATAIL
jgi:hypothetical protein